MSKASLASISLPTNRITVNCVFWKTAKGQLFKIALSSIPSHSKTKRTNRMQSMHFQHLNCYPQVRGSKFPSDLFSSLPHINEFTLGPPQAMDLSENCFCLQLIGFFLFFEWKKNALKISFFIVFQTTWAQQTDLVFKVTYQHWQCALKNSCCLIDYSVNIFLNLETILLRRNIAHLVISP